MLMSMSEKEMKYKVLGESGLVEDEEGNVYSADEIFPRRDTKEIKKTSTSALFSRNSFVSELDDKCNPAHWYYDYDPRYCGPDREKWMEEMAAKHRKMRAKGEAEPILGSNRAYAEPKPDHAYYLCDATKAHADLAQNEVVRLGIHPTYRKDFDYIRGLGFVSVVDQFGNVILDNERYKFVGQYYNYGLAMAQDRKSELWGYVDRHGREVVECKWRSVGHFSEYMAAVQDTNRKVGFVDVNGYIAIQCKWEEAWPFREGVAKVQNEKLLGLINHSGEMVTPCMWKAMGEMNEGLISVRDDNGKCGYIDKSGKVVIPCKWREAWSFKMGLAVVQDWNKRLGFIDTSGEVVIPCRWRKISQWDGHTARVTESGGLFRKEKWVHIDRTGKVIREE